MRWFLLVIGGLVVLYLGFQAVLCAVAVKKAALRLVSYHAKTIQLSDGQMTYVDSGNGEPVLVVHGICGGYDQGYNAAVDTLPGKRIIAPSRFGYLGSGVPEDPSPRAQAKAFAELLDALKIERVYVMAASAGGTSAIRFALDYPDRTKGLILVSSAPPMAERPSQYPEYQGPPLAMCNNYAMWLFSPLFNLTMGFESDMIYEMLPLDDRKEGVRIDATISNPDMARNYDQYPIEELQVKTIIFHAEDDKLASYADMEKASSRFPNCNFVSFESGGHKLEGHSAEIISALDTFMK